MEKYLLVNFQEELKQIKNYIIHIEQINSLADSLIDENNVQNSFESFTTHFKSFNHDKKIFEYKAIIISLYGLLEKHIELWIKEYLQNTEKLIEYNKLSENIKNRHFEFSLKLMNTIIEGRQAKYNNLKKEDVLKKLNTCIEKPTSYKLNVDSFTMQTGNLTHKRIEEIFKTIDIVVGKELIKNKEIIYILNLTDTTQNIKSEILFQKINDLVDRRNTIAHGAAKIDDLVDLPILKDYAEFLETYCIAIFSILEEKVIENHTIEKYKIVECKGVFQNKSIIGISIENYIIKKGEWIIIKTSEESNEHFYKKEIRSLGKDKKNDFSELEIKEKEDVAVLIDNQESLPITKNCSFYIIKK